MKTNQVNIETFKIKGKSKRYFTKRDSKGRFEAKRRVARSGLKLNEVRNIYKENKTLYKNIKAEKLYNVTEYSQLYNSSIQSRDKKKLISRKPKKDAQYVVQGYYNSNKVVARSFKVGSSEAVSGRVAKEQAWNNFLERLSGIGGLAYDADEGVKLLDKVTNIKEGWVYYK